MNGSKPSKPKDLGWDYQKDKEAKRVFKKEERIAKVKRGRKGEKFLDNVLNVGILNIQGHVLVNYVEGRDMSLKIVPS